MDAREDERQGAYPPTLTIRVASYQWTPTRKCERVEVGGLIGLIAALAAILLILALWLADKA